MTVLVLMLAVAVLALLASKVGVPYPTMMVVGGLVIFFVLQGKLTLTLDPKIIFTLFLPPLLYGAAWQMSWREFWAARRQIFLLAVGLVLFTTAGIALLVMWLIPGFTWPAAFALGAIISPPDAIAVTAMTKKVRLPRRLILLLEGESLVNDASALVALKFAVAAAMTGTFSLVHATGQFLFVAAGGVLLGAGVGWLVAEIHRRMRDPLVETAITFLTPYATYLLGEQIHVSGVLATVAAGLYVSWQAPTIMKPQVRLESYAVWGFVLFVLNGFVFVMLGLGLPAVLRELPDFSTRQLIGYGVLVTAGIVLLRMAWVVPGSFIPWLVTRGRRKPEPRPSARQSLLLGWTGMRGVVSLAAALALPITISSGDPFPNRGIIIFLTFFVILVTLVVQSLTLPMVVRLIGVQTAEDEAAEEREARLHAARAAMSFLKDLTESTDAFGDMGRELKEEYDRRIAYLEAGPAPLPVAAAGFDTSFMDLQREVLSAQRHALLELRANQKVSPEIFQRIMADVDGEELRLVGR
jgi:CPA1 family monovalent cation:H+ antiporter